jgi:hypothetical protein
LNAFQIIRNVPKYEISRYLLTTLILTNCGNIEILDEVGGTGINQSQVIVKSSRLKLLSLERRNEVFADEQLLIGQ